MEDWQDYYSILGRSNERSGGLPADINRRMTEHAQDHSQLANDLVDEHAQVILLFPQAMTKGSSASVGLLHQCVAGEQLPDVTGIPDLLRFTPPRSVAFGSLVRPFSVPDDRRDDPVPTATQLLKTSSFADFISTKGDGSIKAGDLATIPAFVRIHPTLASLFIPLEDDLNPESIFTEVLLAGENTPGKVLIQEGGGMGALLQFLWATGNGFVGTRARMKTPDYGDLALVSERAFRRFQELKAENEAVAEVKAKRSRVDVKKSRTEARDRRRTELHRTEKGMKSRGKKSTVGSEWRKIGRGRGAAERRNQRPGVGPEGETGAGA